MKALSEEQVRAYRRDGFLVVKNIINADRLAIIHQSIKSLPIGTNLPLFAIPGLEDFWAEPVLTEIAGQLLACTPVFHGEANAVVSNPSLWPTLGRHLHHDAKGTRENIFNRVHAEQSSVYPVVRFGIYLQDHGRYSGGLKLVPGSHLLNSAHFPENLTYYNVPSQPGDLVCFCQRTLHSGLALRPKMSLETAFSCDEEDIMSARNPNHFAEAPSRREVIFLNYSNLSEAADLNAKNRALANGGIYEGWARHMVSLEAEWPIRTDAALVEAILSDPIDDALIQKIGERHFETSLFYPFWSDQGTTAMREHIIQYRQTIATANHDLHMGVRPLKHHLALREEK